MAKGVLGVEGVQIVDRIMVVTEVKWRGHIQVRAAEALYSNEIIDPKGIAIFGQTELI